MRVLVFAVLALPFLRVLPAGDSISLTKAGVACDLGARGVLTLGIPALDGRNAHAPPLPDSIVTDGRDLTARFGTPFDGVTLRMRIMDGGRVEYTYDALPPDVRLVMCQFNLPAAGIVPGLTVAFDQLPPREIPVTPGRDNDAVRLVNVNARSLSIKWPSGEGVSLEAPQICWHGIQDARVWGRSFVGICLTPPLKRDMPDGGRSTFTMTFQTSRATGPDSPDSTR